MKIPVEGIILAFGYLGVFGLMIANGLLSFPSSQILYIIVGYFVSQGSINLWLVSIFGALGNTIGNIFLYELTRSRGLKYVARWQVIPEVELKKVEAAFRRRGWWFVFVGKLLPAIKVFVPIAAGLAKMPRALFAILMFLASWIWSLIFIYIGYFFGKSENIMGRYAIVLAVISVLLIVLFYRYMNSKEVLQSTHE